MANEAFKKGLEGTLEIELTVTGRKSGREISLPVWFVHDGDKLYLVPVTGRCRGGGAARLSARRAIYHPA